MTKIHLDEQSGLGAGSDGHVYEHITGHLLQADDGMEAVPLTHDRLWRRLPEHLTKGGYPAVWLKGRKVVIRRIICRAFHGPPDPPYAVVVSKDGDPANNDPDNLAWATPPRKKEPYSQAWVKRRA